MNRLQYSTWATRAARIAAASAALTLLPPLQAQQSGNALAGPTQGFTYDAASRSVRQVLGSFGSASLGPALVQDLSFGSVAPQRSYGIGCVADQCFLVTGLGSDQAQQNPIPDQVGIPEGATWSADGRVAVLYSRSGQWLRVLRGLPETIDAGPQSNVSSLGGQLSSVAVSPDGGQIVLGMAGDQPGIFEMTAAGAFVPMHSAVNPVALAFSKNGDTLYILDAGSHEVSEIHVSDGLAQSWPIEAVQDPIGVQVGQDSAARAVIYVAGRGDQTLFVYDRASHNLLEQIQLTFAPSQLEPSGTSSYLLTSRSSADEVLWSFTAGRGIFFVPVTPTEAETPQRRVRR